jgi:uncharacterized membrane protein
MMGKKIGLGFVFAWFFFGGIGHFIITDFFTSIVPPWVPWPVLAVYVSGVFEILGACGILLPRFRAVAGFGLMLLTLAVTPANVHMWLNPDQFPDIPEAALTIRLFIQVALLWCIWWSTRTEKPAAQLQAA